jgi:uncharacterized protein (DUF169 family)
MSQGINYSQLAATLAASLDLQQAPVAISFADSLPASVKSHAGRVPAGCRFWEDGAVTAFATSASDHSLCAIGVYTHNLQTSPAQQTDLMDALKVFGDLEYVRQEDLAFIPVLASQPAYVVYAPLADSPLPPDVVLLFVNANQTLILSEATQQVENQNAPAMGRPACAIVPQVMNTGTMWPFLRFPATNSRPTHGESRPWPKRMVSFQNFIASAVTRWPPGEPPQSRTPWQPWRPKIPGM